MGRRGRPPYPDILTPREWEVVSLLRQGLNNPQIAEQLGIGISRDGAKYHVSEIIGKLGVTSRFEAAVWQPTQIPWWRTATPAFLAWPFRNLLSGSAPKAAGGTAMAASATIIGLTLTAVGSLGTLAGVIWLSAIRSGFEFPRRYGPLTIRRALIVTAAAAPLAVVGYLISDARNIPYLLAVFLAGGSLVTFGIALGLSLVARVRNGGSRAWSVTVGAVVALVITSLISLGTFIDDGDFPSSLILVGFAVLLISTVGGVLWLPVALIRRRGRSATAAFVWSAASLAVVGGIGFGILIRFGAAPTIEGLELLAVTLDEERDAPMAGVYVHGSYAFVGGQSTSYPKKGRHKQGIRILDISNPAAPQLVGRIPLRSVEKFNTSGEDAHSHGDAVATRIESAAFQGDVAIVLQGIPDTFTVGENPLPYGIWDVTDPANPQFLSVLNLGNHYQFDYQGDKPNDDKAAHGHYFYAVYTTGQAANGHNDAQNMAIVDLSDPRNPVVVGDWHDSGLQGSLTGLSLNVAGTRAYIVGRKVIPEDGGHRHTESVLHVLDVHDPTAPVELGRYVYPHQKHLPYAVPNKDDTLVVFADGSGPCGQKAAIRLLDVSDPSSIHELSAFQLSGSDRCYLWGSENVGEATDIAVKGNLVYSTWMGGGLRVIDISDPTNPVEAGKFILSPGSPWLSDVALYGDVVLATEIWAEGLYLLR